MSNIQESGEMYLESILVLKSKLGQVRSIDVVHHTGYSKPSISRALGLLRADGMVTMDDSGYIELTEEGKLRATKVYERHRILAEFFESIGVSAEVADSDACKVEHVISDETFECIKDHITNQN
jgi:Mn-dependent DtxR family transcriptional regulator